MRYIVFVSCFLAVVTAAAREKKPPVKPKEISIEIHNNQYSCCSSQEYYIEGDKLTVCYFSEHGSMYEERYQPDTLLRKRLSSIELKRFDFLLDHFPFERLKPVYESTAPANDEVREISVSVRYGNKSAHVQISGCYQENIATLFRVINSVLPDEKKGAGIEYEKGKFQCIDK